MGSSRRTSLKSRSSRKKGLARRFLRDERGLSTVEYVVLLVIVVVGGVGLPDEIDDRVDDELVVVDLDDHVDRVLLLVDAHVRHTDDGLALIKDVG